jgi:hypothetical protein
MDRTPITKKIVNCTTHDITVLSGVQPKKDSWTWTAEEIEELEILAVFKGTQNADHELRLSGFYPDATEEDKEPPLRAARAKAKYAVTKKIWTPETMSIDDSSPMLHQAIPILHGAFSETVGLPDTEKGTWYIVSAITASANPKRKDLLVVFSTIKDPSNPRQILGCQGFTQPNASD